MQSRAFAGSFFIQNFSKRWGRIAPACDDLLTSFPIAATTILLATAKSPESISPWLSNAMRRRIQNHEPFWFARKLDEK